VLPFLALAALLVDESSIEGRWRSPGGNSIIDIAPCGTELCGTVAWASEKAKHDARRATNQLIGTQLLTSLQEKKPGRWEGRLFIPDKSLRVTSKIQLAGPQQLKVSGCAIICSSQLWNRFEGPLPE